MLWWLFALAIPLIVHLFNFRRHKTLLFSDVRLLKNLQQQTNKQRKLKHLLILVMRMLSIAALVMAFARPYLKPDSGAPDEGRKHISVYLDNSLSMQLRGERMSMLDELRRHASTLPEAFRMDDQFRLISNDFLPQHQVLMSGTEFLQELGQVRNNAMGVDLGQVLQRLQQSGSRDEKAGRFIYLLSDFQRSALNFQNLEPDSSYRLFLVQGSPAQKNNISIDTCWIDNPVLLPGQPAVFNVRISNRGSNAVEALPVTLSLNGQQKAASSIDIAAGRIAELVLQFIPEEAGHYQAVVAIIDDPVTFDDELNLTFEVRSALPVLEIYERNPSVYLNLLLGNDARTDFQSAQRLRLDLQTLNAYETIILNGLDDINTGLAAALDDFLNEGGKLLIFPSTVNNASTALFAERLGMVYSPQPDTNRSRVSMLQTDHPLLSGAFGKVPDNAELPWVRRWFTLSAGQGQPAQAPVSLLNGRPLLLAANIGQGMAFAYAVPLDQEWTNLMNNNLFVALIYRSLLVSNKNQGLYQLLDGPVTLPLGNYAYNDRAMPELVSVTDGRRILPELVPQGNRTVAVVYPELLQPGFYALKVGDSLLTRLAVNESRKESVMDFASAEEVKSMLKDIGYHHVEVITPDARGLGQAVRDYLTGRPIHQLFVWLVLAFLLAEILIIRFFRN